MLYLKINYTGCALCNSTWGDYYATIEGTELFFCCEVCSSIYKKVVDKVKTDHQLKSLDYLEIEGTPRERFFTASSGNKTFKGRINFLQGNIIKFQSSEVIK